MPFFYTASNGFKEFVWVCVKDWGGGEHITHMESGYMLGPVRLTWVWGDAFIHKTIFHSQGALVNFGSRPSSPLGILESLVVREVPSCNLIWSSVPGHYIHYVKYYKY